MLFERGDPFRIFCFATKYVKPFLTSHPLRLSPLSFARSPPGRPGGALYPFAKSVFLRGECEFPWEGTLIYKKGGIKSQRIRNYFGFPPPPLQPTPVFAVNTVQIVGMAFCQSRSVACCLCRAAERTSLYPPSGGAA